MRHGTTTAPEGVAIGSSDPPLSPVGRDEAAALAAELSGRPLARIFSSDKIRAITTAETIAAVHGLQVIIDPRLREIDFGAWEGSQLGDLWTEDPSSAAAWEKDLRSTPASFGESLADLEARVSAFWSDWRPGPDQEVAVVAHRGSLSALRTLITGESIESTFKAGIERGSAIWIGGDGAVSSSVWMRTDELVAQHHSDWESATRGPFLDAVRDGSLPEAAFEKWLVQDYLFVLDLLRFQARLLAVAPRSGQRVLAGGLVALEAELAWFEGHGARRGIRLEGERYRTTEAYRRQLESNVDDWRSGITALWTGERAYLESWSGVAPGAPAYRDFVSRWTDPGFSAYVAELATQVDAAGADESTFLNICALERDFWGMAWDSATT